MLGTNHDADIVEFIKTLKKKYKVACLTNVETEIADNNLHFEEQNHHIVFIDFDRYR
jgi:FMN phosphatase YigB (HAD superfamily)